MVVHAGFPHACAAPQQLPLLLLLLVNVCAAAPGWVTVLGCEDRLRGHHNYFSVDVGGLALTHLRLGVRRFGGHPNDSSGAGYSCYDACARTAVLRLRVYGQLALGNPPSSPEEHLKTDAEQQEQEQQQEWHSRGLQELTSLLQGAAVISGPQSGVWASQSRQELLMMRNAQGADTRWWVCVC